MLRLAVMLDDEKARVEEVKGQNADLSPHLAVLSVAASSTDACSSEAGTVAATSCDSKTSEPSPQLLFDRVVSLLLALPEPLDRSYVSRYECDPYSVLWIYFVGKLQSLRLEMINIDPLLSAFPFNHIAAPLPAETCYC